MKKWVPGGIRVTPQHEIEGLDLSECGVEAYGEELRGFAAFPETELAEPLES